MNENINLVEILKDCPKGTKFYSSVYGVVIFDNVYPAARYPIKVHNEQFGSTSFNAAGKMYYFEDSECTIFPSKDQRDWNVWHNNRLKEKTQKAFQSFNDGDYIHFGNTGDEWTVIYRKTEELELRGYACVSDDYTSIMDKTSHVGTKPYAFNVRLATPREIEHLNHRIAKFKKQWNPITKEFETIKTEMTISEIEIKLGLPSGSLRVKK